MTEVRFLIPGAPTATIKLSCIAARGGKAVADDPADVRVLHAELGLTFKLEELSNAVIAYVSLKQESLDMYGSKRDESRGAGRLFGYPITAVEAFVAGASMPFDQQRAAEHAFGAPVFSSFRLSRQHAADELEVMHRWWAVLERYGCHRE